MFFFPRKERKEEKNYRLTLTERNTRKYEMESATHRNITEKTHKCRH